ncbi:SLATT domain-containing protein [bacterium LRH843]|nr:SLATT domain-containing protein [bacterium LRH843]
MLQRGFVKLEKKNYIEREVLDEIAYKISTLDKTRNNKIKQSLRLEKYTDMWKVVTFILNVEAVIFVILSLSIGDKIHNSFNIVVSIFSIYVILIQYYVSDQKYGERALKAHYQQLSIEDLILSLKNLLIMNNTEPSLVTKTNLINEFNKIMVEYQILLKNNENHSAFDFISATNEKSSGKISKDFTKDNLMIYANISFCIFVPILLLIMNV